MGDGKGRSKERKESLRKETKYKMKFEKSLRFYND